MLKQSFRSLFLRGTTKIVFESLMSYFQNFRVSVTLTTLTSVQYIAKAYVGTPMENLELKLPTFTNNSMIN